MRWALGLAYDGSAYHGWQTQPGGRTVQDTVEHALQSFLAHPVQVVCAGRTDTGVHALNQVVHLDTDAQRTEYAWLRGVNAFLPSSIALQWVRPATADFHARFSACARRYVYVVRNAPVRSPLLAGRVGWMYRPLSLSAMQEAAQRLLGEHDFSAFRSAQCQAASPVRTVYQLDISARAPYLYFVFHANAFLHHMIRNIMGALLYVGLGRQAPDWIDELLRCRDRRKSAPTFAPDGLYLADVHYPEHFGLPQGDFLHALHALAAFG